MRLAVPAEANRELFGDSDAPLSLPVALQLLQPVSRPVRQVFYGTGRVNRLQLQGRNACNVGPSPALSGQVDGPSFLIGRGLDHAYRLA